MLSKHRPIHLNPHPHLLTPVCLTVVLNCFYSLGLTFSTLDKNKRTLDSNQLWIQMLSLSLSLSLPSLPSPHTRLPPLCRPLPRHPPTFSHRLQVQQHLTALSPKHPPTFAPQIRLQCELRVAPLLWSIHTSPPGGRSLFDHRTVLITLLSLPLHNRWEKESGT